MVQEPSGVPGVQVVEPGSADDPFSTNNAPSVPTEDPDATETPNAPSQPDNDVAPDEGKDLLALEELIQTRVSSAHSGLDKRINALQKQNETLEAQLAETRKASRDAERRARAEGLSEEEKAILERQYLLEDQQQDLEAKVRAVDEYRRFVTAYDLVARFGKYGVTADILEEANTPEDMEVLAERTAREFLEKGGKPGQVEGPAGTKAPSDLGGRPPGPEPFKLGTEQGVDGMAQNVKGLFSQPGQVR